MAKEKEEKEEIKSAKAVAKYVRSSPRKVRRVIDLIRGKSVNSALAILQFTPNFSAKLVGKVLKSAIANAENNYLLNREKLYVSYAFVDCGPSLPPRFLPRAHGRATPIKKRTSHITVIVQEKEG